MYHALQTDGLIHLHMNKWMMDIVGMLLQMGGLIHLQINIDLDTFVETDRRTVTFV